MDLWEAGIWRPKMPALTPQPVVPAGNKKKEKNDKRKIKKMRSGGSWDVGILRPNIPREMGCLRFRHSLMSPQAYLYIYVYTHTHTRTYTHTHTYIGNASGPDVLANISLNPFDHYYTDIPEDTTSRGPAYNSGGQPFAQQACFFF